MRTLDARMYYNLERVKPKDYVKVGQEVYVIGVNNLARDGQNIETSIVKKVGRKYFTVENYDCKFFTEHGYIRDFSEYCSSYHIYLSKEDKEKDIQFYRTKSLLEKVSLKFNNCKIQIDDERLNELRCLLENILDEDEINVEKNK